MLLLKQPLIGPKRAFCGCQEDSYLPQVFRNRFYTEMESVCWCHFAPTALTLFQRTKAHEQRCQAPWRPIQRRQPKER